MRNGPQAACGGWSEREFPTMLAIRSNENVDGFVTDQTPVVRSNGLNRLLDARSRLT